MTERGLAVTRWQRYGHDRAYVKGIDGVTVGWVDLHTGAHTIEIPEQRAAFEDAIASSGLVVTDDRQLPPEPGPEPAWLDLADHRPGQLARERALAERAALRERSRLLALVARVFDLKTDERAWRVGADGEEVVGARLGKLRQDEWRVLHSVPVGCRGSDIDHVVIGPGGVYTVNTKNHPGKRIWVGHHQVRVGGQPVKYVPKSRFEAERASKILTAAVGFQVPVMPVLVFLTRSLAIKQRPEGVMVLGRSDVPGVFRRAPRVLALDAVEAIFAVARKSTTWLT